MLNLQEGFNALGVDQPVFEFGSEIRHRPDDDGVFEQTILREGQIAHLPDFQANFNLFEQPKADRLNLMEKDGIEFSGFGLNFSVDSVEEDHEEKRANRAAKKQEKLRKNFEKLMLGQDANINSLDVYKSQKQPVKNDYTNIADAFSFEANTALLEATTGVTTKSSSIVQRVITKQDDEQIKRDFVQELLKQEADEEMDKVDKELSGFDFFGGGQDFVEIDPPEMSVEFSPD
jgi:hypothetical protein